MRGQLWLRRSTAVALAISIGLLTAAAATNTVAASSGPTDGVATAAGRLWVTDTKLNEVTVFDATTGTVLERVAVGQKPIGVTAPPGIDKVYVSNEKDGTVSVISRTTMALENTIPVGKGSDPHHVAHSPDGGRVYVALYGMAAIAVIDTSSDTVEIMRSGRRGSRTHAVGVSPDGSSLYVTNTKTNDIQRLDPEGRIVGDPIPVGAGPSEVLISPDGRTAYVSLKDEHRVEIVDLLARKVVGSIPVGKKPDTLTFGSGNRLIVALRATGPSGLVTVIETGAKPAAHAVPVGGTSTGHQAVSPGGRYTYVAITGPAPGVAVVDLDSRSVMTTWPTGAGGSPHGVFLDAVPGTELLG